ncbi:hypothetical protein BUALT_Bualt16G0115600 [Buddleja alternifolia]|uniref:EF-hand domain-containing protein n=1 Tax=Buddleja alternifolia TaxID=168488 RepID=A0AAV6WBJ8_9LAMI|nr:hypothetical protein BUALT_Bualt16G0115600 [Buddleja alternifolia]
MKFTKIIPKKLFKSKKSHSISRSESAQSSFSSLSTTSSSSSDKPTTPTTVLPSLSAAEPSENSIDVYSDLKHAFEAVDSDGDGKILTEELELLLRRLGAEPPSQEEMKMMLNEVDSDGDGCVTLEEFYAIGAAFAPVAAPCGAEMKEAFDFFDSDRDGVITAEELFNVFLTIGEGRCTLEDCRRMIGGVDSNGDGFVCFEDFSRMMDQHQR